jgi:hypothetical protein
MANTPAPFDVPTLVGDRISRSSRVVLTKIETEMSLADDLGMEHQALVDLAVDLRAIVKLKNKNGTIVVADVEDGSATVQSTIDLVQQRIAGQ